MHRHCNKRGVLPHEMQQMESQDAGGPGAGCTENPQMEKPLTRRGSWRPCIQVRVFCLKFLPHHFPIFTFPLPRRPKHDELTLEPKELQMERSYSCKRKNIHNAGNWVLQGITFCFPHTPWTLNTWTLNLHHRLLQNIVFFSFKRQLSELQWGLIRVPGHFHLFLKAGAAICWEQKEGHDAK